MDLLPSSVVAPVAENSVDSLPVGEVVWQESPSAATAQDVEDCVDDGAAANSPGGCPKRGLRQELAKNLPLLVGEVRGIFCPFRVGHRFSSFSFRGWKSKGVVPFFTDLVNSKTRSESNGTRLAVTAIGKPG